MSARHFNFKILTTTDAHEKKILQTLQSPSRNPKSSTNNSIRLTPRNSTNIMKQNKSLPKKENLNSSRDHIPKTMMR